MHKQLENDAARSEHSLERIEPFGLSTIGFVSLHLGCLLIFWVDVSWVAVAACFATYHHYAPSSARLGFTWWEFDPAYHALRAFHALGIITEMNPPFLNRGRE